MQKQTNPVARVFAILFVILFVVSSAGTLLIFNIFKQAFNPEFYQNAISSTGIYEQLPDLIGKQIVYSISRNACLQNPAACTEEQLNATPAYLASVDATEWKVILSGLVDPAWVRAQVESSIDQVVTSLSTPGQTLQLDISLVEIKNKMRGEAGYQAILNLLNSLEPCTTADLFGLPGAALNTDNPVNLPLCRPSESVLKLSESAIRETLKIAADKIPDSSATIINTNMPGFANSLAITQRGLQLLRTLALISPIVPLGFLLIITLLVVRSLKDFLRWWGVPLVSLAGLIFISSLIMTPVVRIVISARVNTVGLAPGWIDAIHNIILQATESFRNTLTIQAGVILFAGCLMLIAAALIHPKSESTTK